MDIRYEYSASLLEELNREKPSLGFTGFAPVYSNEFTAESRDGENRCELLESYDFANLSNNQKEVRNIAKLIRGKIFNGRKATESNFLEIAPDAQILHLAMHGFINECDPLYSGLAFTGSSLNMEETEPPLIDTSNQINDDLLYAYEIYNLSLKADLTVLSACNTGSGQSAEGEGIMSLARAFKHAGCPNVVMSLWQADDKSTAYIMEAFYENLKDGMGKANALKKAKLDYVKNHRFAHPFFWGGFVLIGDNQVMELASSLWLMYGTIILGIILIILGGIIFMKRRKAAKDRRL